MFSVVNTGTNFRPLCTAKVTPSISGMMVERRDQVFSTFLDLTRCASTTFFMRLVSTNGPFLIERAMAVPLGLLAATLDDHRVGALVLPRLQALGQLAPRRAGMTTA